MISKRAFMYHYVFVMDSNGYAGWDVGGYDPWITSFVDVNESNARYNAWQEIKEQWDLEERVEGQLSNGHGRALLVSCYATEPGAYHKHLL